MLHRPVGRPTTRFVGCKHCAGHPEGRKAATAAAGNAPSAQARPTSPTRSWPRGRHAHLPDCDLEMQLSSPHMTRSVKARPAWSCPPANERSRHAPRRALCAAARSSRSAAMNRRTQCGRKAIMHRIPVPSHPLPERKTPMRILFVNNDGGGFADYVDVPPNTTVEQVLSAGRSPDETRGTTSSGSTASRSPGLRPPGRGPRTMTPTKNRGRVGLTNAPAIGNPGRASVMTRRVPFASYPRKDTHADTERKLIPPGREIPSPASMSPRQPPR